MSSASVLTFWPAGFHSLVAPTVLLITSRHGLHRKYRSSAAVYVPLSSCFAVVTLQRVYMPQYIPVIFMYAEFHIPSWKFKIFACSPFYIPPLTPVTIFSNLIIIQTFRPLKRIVLCRPPNAFANYHTCIRTVLRSTIVRWHHSWHVHTTLLQNRSTGEAR
jgi:hypothetical protein